MVAVLPQSISRLPLPPGLALPRASHAVYPVFLPFQGCPVRCVFCAQDTQTGIASGRPVTVALAKAQTELEARQETGLAAPELAFYGGTFTMLPADDLRASLSFAARCLERGLVTRVRCSTRPDALSPPVLEALHSAGVTLVELGIQSFSSQALALSRRGYTGETAQRACAAVCESGFSLGVQLMPGMPGHSPHEAEADIDATLAAHPEYVRLYPCLVLEGTPLAQMWREQRFSPWALDVTVDVLANAVLRLWQADIGILRIGLAEDERFVPSVLAGPRHPALGGVVKAQALFTYVRSALCTQGQGAALRSFFAPRRLQGMFWGDKGALVPAYAGLGITPENISWWDENAFGW